MVIYKISDDMTIDFAAQELKKYVQMMSVTPLNVDVRYLPSASDGFRIGLMQDFGLDVSDVKDAALDDIIYIDTTEAGGIIAGGNGRSVLLAVYEFLRIHGCRWLFPGIDGEYIPECTLRSVKLRHKPSMRYRGYCLEGSVSQEILLDTIDFLPKLGMNMFLTQFFLPVFFYQRYYEHWSSTARASEPLSEKVIRRWKVECEAALSLRGIQYHDVGHGWSAAPFGFDISTGWNPIGDSDIPESQRRFLALLDGERKLYGGVPINTQFCMSSREARSIVARSVADYAEAHSSVDYIHVWLGDGNNNHCECSECSKLSVSDWYVMLLNDIDEELTRRNLGTRIVFAIYTETTWAPERERIKNQDRFTLMMSPISRSYTKTLDDTHYEIKPFVRNHIMMPKALGEYMLYLEEWRKTWHGAALVFEYHFWRHQMYEPSGIILARRISNDIDTYIEKELDGIVACGSPRAAFPNGFAFYVFARRQFDSSLTIEELTKDYFGHAYNECGQEVYEYLSDIANAMPQSFLEGEESDDVSVSKHFSFKNAKKLEEVRSITKRGRRIAKKLLTLGERPASALAQILSVHSDYLDMLADALILKARGSNDEATEAFERMREFISEREVYIERYFDFNLAMEAYRMVFKNRAREIQFGG